MNKFLEFINGLEIKTIFNIAFIIAIVVAGLYIRQLWHDKGGLNAQIDTLKIEKAEQEQQIKEKNQKIKELDKKSRKVKKELDEKNKELDDIKKGTSMDDAINLYNSGK